MGHLGRRASHLWVVAVGVLVVAPAVARAERLLAPAAEGTDESLDQKAKRLFAAGRYSEAIEILAQLYSQTNNPIYLRNIGRCYQRLPDPERAIASFEEYLLRGRNISRTEREEVRGFIRELQEQKQRNSQTSAAPEQKPRNSPTSTAPAPSAGPAAPSSPQIGQPPGSTAPTNSPVRQPAAPPVVTDPPPAVVQQPPMTPPSPLAAVEPGPTTPPLIAPTAFPPADNLGASAPPGRPIGRTLAIAAMGLAGALAVTGGVVMATSWSRYKSAEKTCLLKANCAEAASTVESRNKLAKILLVGAVVTGAAGVTVYLLNPARPGETGVALAIGGRF